MIDEEKPMGDGTGRVLAAIRDHMRARGYPPTIREIGRAAGMSSTSVVEYHLRKLARRGDISRPEIGAPRVLFLPDAWMQFAGDEVLVEVDGQVVRGRAVEPVGRAA